MSNTKQPTFSEWYDSLTPDKRAEIERRTVTDQNHTGVYAESYADYVMKWWAGKDTPTDEELENMACSVSDCTPGNHCHDCPCPAFEQGAQAMYSIIAGLRKEVSALERFRAEDAMSAINEANQLRKELAEAKEENQRLLHQVEKEKENADHCLDVAKKIMQVYDKMTNAKPDSDAPEEHKKNLLEGSLSGAGMIMNLAYRLLGAKDFLSGELDFGGEMFLLAFIRKGNDVYEIPEAYKPKQLADLQAKQPEGWPGIKWKKVGDSVPTNVNKHYAGSPETPFVSCIVWVCNPDIIIGGVVDSIRWDTKNACWHEPDMNKWFYDAPLQITHFYDNINAPLLEQLREKEGGKQ